MSKIIDEIKKISKENKFDISKFESVYDLIAELEEEKETAIKTNNNYETIIKENEKKLEDKNKEYEELQKENENNKKSILDLKEKYIDRFNEFPTDKKNNTIKTDITINDLFKEE